LVALKSIKKRRKNLNKGTSNYKASLVCIKCGAVYNLNSVIYKCEKCEGLLSVEHDTDAIKSQNADFWKDLFNKRFRTGNPPYNSGIWGKKEWVLPGIDDKLFLPGANKKK